MITKGKIQTPYLQLLFMLAASLLVFKFGEFPKSMNWDTVLFLCIMAVFDRINLKVFSGFGYSFFIVILSLIIFDRYSSAYGFFFIATHFFISILMNKNNGKISQDFINMPISFIVIIETNLFYNNLTHHDYFARYISLLLILSSSIFLRYLYTYLETGRMTTKHLLDTFAPIMFEILIIFPILALYGQVDTNFILILFLSYYTIIGYLHKKFLEVNQNHIDTMIKKVEERYELTIRFADLKEVKGAFLPQKKVIFIDNKLDYPEQLQTIIHETIHYWLRDKISVPKQIEEIIVVIFEAVFSWYIILILKRRYID